ncbi:MAG: hypothetical protein KatS3mg108_1897 [Isosphaeraceae bacterium]|nr:MAG: hypothetical protein KatS3mg108_1897 [Isosphaeraceae bacterium]
MAGESEVSAAQAWSSSRRLPVPEVRDYHQINRRVTQWLDAGVGHVVLEGVERQRLLLAGLRGDWAAVVEVRGQAGPELAAELNAPNLLVVAQAGVDDGAGRGLTAGSLIVRGDCGAGLGYRQAGGIILACGGVGPRLGLEQRGGVLIALGSVDWLAGERQRGGSIWLPGASQPRLAGRGQVAGRLVAGSRSPEWIDLAERTLRPLATRFRDVVPWLGSVLDAAAGA